MGVDAGGRTGATGCIIGIGAICSGGGAECPYIIGGAECPCIIGGCSKGGNGACGGGCEGWRGGGANEGACPCGPAAPSTPPCGATPSIVFARGRVPTGDAPACIDAGSGSALGVAMPWSGMGEGPLGGGRTTGVPSGSVRGAGSYEGGTYGPTDVGAIDGRDGGAGSSATSAAGRWLCAPACAIDGAERGTIDAGGATEGARGASGARDDFDIGGTERGASDGFDFGGTDRAETRSGGAFGASDMRVVIGCALTGGRSAFSVTSASARPKSGGSAAAVAASSSPLVALRGATGETPPGVMLGGAPLDPLEVRVSVSGVFAAGATPHIVFVCFERAFTGRGIAPKGPPERDELTSFRSSDRVFRPY